jgi:hypothetical protein
MIRWAAPAVKPSPHAFTPNANASNRVRGMLSSDRRALSLLAPLSRCFLFRGS